MCYIIKTERTKFMINPEIIAAAKTAAKQVTVESPTVPLPEPHDRMAFAVSSKGDVFDGPAMTTITVDDVKYYVGTLP